MAKRGAVFLLRVGLLLFLFACVASGVSIVRTTQFLLEPVDVNCTQGRVVGFSVDFATRQFWVPARHRQSVFEIELQDGKHVNVSSSAILAPVTFRGPVHVQITRGLWTERERYVVFLSGSCT